MARWLRARHAQHLWAALLTSGFLFLGTHGAVADEPKPSVRIQHRPLDVAQLPAAGTLMPISLQLENSSEVDTKIRLVGSRDGRFMDIAFPMGVLNMSDRPTFTINVPAPTALMTYQFIVHQPNGELSLSPKFTIQRSCIQNFRVDIPEGEPSSQYRKEIATLMAKARSLERDTARLETAIKLVEALKRDLPE
jgi:hypothetical protein